MCEFRVWTSPSIDAESSKPPHVSDAKQLVSPTRSNLSPRSIGVGGLWSLSGLGTLEFECYYKYNHGKMFGTFYAAMFKVSHIPAEAPRSGSLNLEALQPKTRNPGP